MPIGTYDLCISGWPLLVLGTDLCLDDGKTTHSCLPFVFAWVKSEPAFAYRELFKAYPYALKTFYGLEITKIKPLNIIAGVMDHSEAIG